MKIVGRADLAREMTDLDGKLDALYRNIVLREATTGSVRNVRTDCNKYFLALEGYKRELLDSPSQVDQELAGSISTLNKKLRAVREALGQLVDILRVRDESPRSRQAPSGFERKHGTAESAIEHIRQEISLITRESGGASGLQEHNRRRRGFGELDGREYRRLIS